MCIRDRSLEVLNQMANQSGNRGGATQSVSLYNLYKNRSYACTVTMMGNALIQPTMYFNLRYVPMFSGPYMIQKVIHTITPGNFETMFEGIRQPTASLPKVENYIQSLKTTLLQSIIEKNKKDKADKLKSATTSTTKNNVINEKNSKVDSNTKKEVTKPQNTQECLPGLTTDNKYSTFTPETPTTTTATYKEVIELINSKLINKPIKLGYVVFAKMFLNSSQTEILKTQSYNYGGTDLEQDWGASVKEYFTKKQYYCGGDRNTKPYVIFDSLEQNINFLISRYEKRITQVNNINATEITKFIILYSDSLIAQDNVYTTMNSTELSNMEFNVSQSIKIYNQVLGDYNKVI
jgi:hypothetical protein